jgi:hypothetical protein
MFNSLFDPKDVQKRRDIELEQAKKAYREALLHAYKKCSEFMLFTGWYYLLKPNSTPSETDKSTVVETQEALEQKSVNKLEHAIAVLLSAKETHGRFSTNANGVVKKETPKSNPVVETKPTDINYQKIQNAYRKRLADLDAKFMEGTFVLMPGLTEASLSSATSESSRASDVDAGSESGSETNNDASAIKRTSSYVSLEGASSSRVHSQHTSEQEKAELSAALKEADLEAGVFKQSHLRARVQAAHRMEANLRDEAHLLEHDIKIDKHLKSDYEANHGGGTVDQAIAKINAQRDAIISNTNLVQGFLDADHGLLKKAERYRKCLRLNGGASLVGQSSLTLVPGAVESCLEKRKVEIEKILEDEGSLASFQQLLSRFDKNQSLGSQDSADEILRQNNVLLTRFSKLHLIAEIFNEEKLQQQGRCFIGSIRFQFGEKKRTLLSDDMLTFKGTTVRKVLTALAPFKTLLASLSGLNDSTKIAAYLVAHAGVLETCFQAVEGVLEKSCKNRGDRRTDYAQEQYTKAQTLLTQKSTPANTAPSQTVAVKLG